MVFVGLVLVAVFVMALGVDVVNLASPANNSWTADDNDTIAFTFNWTGENTTASCELFINGTGIGVNATVLNDTNTILLANASIGEGTLNWSVNCTNGTETISSVNWTLNIDRTNPLIDTAYPVNGTFYSIAPTNFNFTYTETNCDKVWYSNDSGVTNSTAQACTSNFTSMVANETSNTWIVYMNDSAGNENSSSVTFTVDTTAPQVTINSPNNTTYTTASITLNTTINENGTCWYSFDAGATTNVSMTNVDNRTFTAALTKTNAAYVVNYYCNDTMGNLNSSESVSFTVAVAAASSGSTTKTYGPSESKMSNGYKARLGSGYRVRFSAGDETHTFRVDSVSKTSAEITIFSDPIVLTMDVGDSEKVDVDSDGYYDLLVYLESISSHKADFVLTTINEVIAQEAVSEVVPEDEETVVAEDVSEEVGQGDVVGEGVTATEEGAGDSVFWWIVGIILLVIILVVFVLKKSRKI